MEFLKALTAWTAFAFAFAILQYIGGRIIAPELGLNPPDFWAWFWLAFLVENCFLWFFLVIQKHAARYSPW